MSTGFKPQSVVQMIPIDKRGDVLIMHRGPNVKSVPNVWSFPSGSHEYGEQIHECAARELMEEFNLQANKIVVLGAYDNLPGDGNHWVIIVVLVLVETFASAVNNEPERHDKMEIISQYDLCEEDFFVRYPFHPSFSEWFTNNLRRVLSSIGLANNEA